MLSAAVFEVVNHHVDGDDQNCYNRSKEEIKNWCQDEIDQPVDGICWWQRLELGEFEFVVAMFIGHLGGFCSGDRSPGCQCWVDNKLLSLNEESGRFAHSFCVRYMYYNWELLHTCHVRLLSACDVLMMGLSGTNSGSP